MILKKKIYLFITIASLLTIINSCKKDKTKAPTPEEQSIRLSGTYTPGFNEEIDTIEMYTINGQVHDSKTIKSFLSRIYLPLLSVAYTDHNKTAGVGPGDYNIASGLTIEFKNNGKAIVTSQFYAYINTPKEYLITDSSSSKFILQQAESSAHVLVCENDIPKTSNAISQFSNCEEITNSDCKGCRFRDMILINVSDGHIYLPFYTYIFSYNRVEVKGYEGSNVRGVFDKNFVKGLLAGDTLLIQAKSVMLNKE